MLINRVTKFIKHQNKYFRNYCNFRKDNLKPPWKLLFFGTDEFSLASLKAVYHEYKKGDVLSNLEVVTLLKNKRNAVEKFAYDQELTVHNWPINPVNCAGFHIGLVVSFGHLIPTNIINSFPLGMLNVHASLLPRWRGAAPIIYAMAHGDEKTGITIMKIKPEKFDVGEIVRQESVEIPRHAKMPEFYNVLAELGAHTLIKTLEDLLVDLNRAVPQPKEGATLAPRVNSKMACIDWSRMSARDVYNLERALTGMFHLTTKFNGVSVKLFGIAECNKIDNDKVVPGFVMYDKGSKRLLVQCADGNCISVERVGVPGKKMSAVDFSNGYLSKQMEHLRIFR